MYPGGSSAVFDKEATRPSIASDFKQTLARVLSERGALERGRLTTCVL